MLQKKRIGILYSFFVVTLHGAKPRYIPKSKEVKSALENCGIFIYFGHMDGQKFILPRNEIERLKISGAQIIMGCYSRKFAPQGIYAPSFPTAVSYMLAGSTTIVAHLWRVKDIKYIVSKIIKLLLYSKRFLYLLKKAL